MNYIQKAFFYTATAFTMFAQGCKKTDDPTPTPVDPVQNVEKVILQIHANADSYLQFRAVLNPGIPQNDAQGIGYAYDLRLYDGNFKATTTANPVVPDVNEAFSVIVNQENIAENNSNTVLKLKDSSQPFIDMTADDGSFFRNNKIDVVAYRVYLDGGQIKATNVLAEHTVNHAFENSKFNMVSDRFKSRLTIMDPTGLPRVPNVTYTAK
ncbi:MAG: hypothetical protein U0X91_03145 [Spirosomataceae bacterium]